MLYGLTYLWNLKNPHTQKQRTDWWLPQVGLEVGKLSKDGQKVQLSNYKITSGDTLCNMVAIVNNTVLYI